MIMDKTKKEDNLWHSWWTCFVYLWYNPNVTAIKFWKSVCSIWWVFYYLFNSLGEDSRQEEAR